MSTIVPRQRDLTLALVGKRWIDPRWRLGMEHDLVLAFEALAGGLDTGPGEARLTLITGLADGADQIACDVFMATDIGGVGRVQGAILPCPADEFARNSPVQDATAFRRALKTCAFITVLHEQLPPPLDGPGSEVVRDVRRDAFAAQADALLKAADILIAIDDPDDAGDVGGTRHTLRRALSRGIPVILIHLGISGVRLPRQDASIETMEPLGGDLAKAALVALVREVTVAKAAG